MMRALRGLWSWVFSPIPKDKTDVGSVVVLLGFAGRDKVDECLARQSTVDRGKQLGVIMVEQDVVTRDQLREVLNTQKQMRGGKAGDVMAVVTARKVRTGTVEVFVGRPAKA